ncbi:MAG: MATE family efflux transporter [Cyanobacteria bacterium J06638_28]
MERNRFLRLAIANIISNLMVPLAGIIDTAFLGHLSEIHYLAGVAIATVIFNMVYWSFGFLRMGTTGLIAQAHGRGDERTVARILLRNGLLAVVLGAGILLLQLPIREVGFWLLSAAPDVRLSGEAFYNARIWGAPVVLLNYVLLGYFLGCGQGKRVVVLSLVGNGGNILLDYWFIRQLGWASAGAGAATALSQGGMAIVGLTYVLRDYTIPYFGQLSRHLWEGTAIWATIRLNRDILIRTFSLLVSFSLFTNWSSTFGTDILAANTLLLQVLTLAAYFIDGIAFATESFAGQFYAVGNRTQLQALLRWGTGVSLCLGVGFAMVFVVFPSFFFGFMTQHEPVIVLVQGYVGWLIPTLGLGAIAFLLDGYFLGLTAGSALRNSTIIATLLGFLPMGILAYTQGSTHLLWLAMTLFMGGRAVTLGLRVPASLAQVPLRIPEKSVS